MSATIDDIAGKTFDYVIVGGGVRPCIVFWLDPAMII